MSQPVGLWLIGARGGVATVAATGLEALKMGQIDTAGLVTALPGFQDLELIDWNDVIIGGHEIRSGSLVEAAEEFQQSSRAFSSDQVRAVGEPLSEIDARIRPGILHHSGSAISQLASQQVNSDSRSVEQKVRALEEDLLEFKQSNGLAHVVVMNVSSTETPIEGEPSSSSN